MKKIDFNLIKSAIFGSVNTYMEDGVIKMRRFSDKQMEHFDKTLNYINKPVKCRTSAGMNIDFYTGSTSLNLELNCYIASPQHMCYVDIYVDGVMMGHFGTDANLGNKLSLGLKMENGKKRVTIYLPCLFETNIVNLMLDDGSFFEPAKKDINIMFLGDSITQGSVTEFPSLTYTNILTNRLNADSINHGIGCALFDASDLDEDFPFKPDIIFVAYGTNDWYHSGDRDLKANADDFYKRLLTIYPKTKIYAILPIWRANIPRVSEIATISFEDMHKVLADVCKKYKVNVIDGLKLTPHCAEFYRPDGTHPNEIGFMQYGEALFRVIRKEFENE